MKDFWNQLIGCIVRIGDYENFIKHSVGKVVLYLLLLTFIASLLYGVKVAFIWNDMVDSTTRDFDKKVPEFVFSNGWLSVNAPMPYIIKKNQEEIIIIDTSGKTNESVLKDYNKGLFVGKSKIVEKKNDLETRTYNLSSLSKITVNKAMMLKYAPWLKWLNVLIVLFMFLTGFIANSLAALIVAICGWIAGRMIKFRLTFTGLYKISIYALTLPLIIELVKDLTGLAIPFFPLIYFSIAVIYVVKVLMALKKKANNNPEVTI